MMEKKPRGNDGVLMPHTRRKRRRSPTVAAAVIVFATTLASYATIANTNQHERDMMFWRLKRRFELEAYDLRQSMTRAVRTTASNTNTEQRRNLQASQVASQNYNTIAKYPCYRTVDATLQTMSDLANQYPRLVKIRTIGQSHRGEAMKVIRLTNSDSTMSIKQRGQMFISCGLHPRELAPVELCIRYAEWLTSRFEVDADVESVLSNTVTHILPMSNPDGRRIVENNPRSFHRKNRNEDYGNNCNRKYQQMGVDLNRNFGFFWGRNDGSSNNPCAETYRGPSPLSEKETKNMVRYAKRIFPRKQRRNNAEARYARPLSRRTTGMHLDVHSYGKVNVFPWGWTDNEKVPGPNFDSYQNLANTFRRFNGYKPSASGLPDYMYKVSGDSVDFYHGKMGVASMLIELGSAFLEKCGSFEDSIVEGNLPVLFQASKLSRRPFKLVDGIEITEVILPQGGKATSGEDIYIKVSIDGSNIMRHPPKNGGLALYVDGHPYDSADMRPAAITDVEFLTPNQAYWTIPTTNLSLGRHRACMEIVDTNGNKGPVTCTFFFVERSFDPS